ncbi:MAG: phage tail spike protein [Pseudolactococcus laudensis]
MINLYKKDETSFGHNGLGSLDNNILNPEISWKDNGAFTLEFRYPLFAKHGFEIENSSIVRANDPEGSNLFFVYKITPSMGYVTVLCYQISYKLAFNSINDTNIVNKSGQNALNQMGNSTQYPHSFTFSSDIQTTATSRVVRKNPIEFLLDSGLDNSFINRWGGHIVRHNFNISMNSAYGSNKGYTIRHKKDLKGYEAEFDESTVITRVRPVGYDGLLLPEIYVDSELIEAYTEPRIQQIEYSNVKVKTKDSDEEGFSTKELAYAELRRLANLEFSENKVDQPDFSAKVEFVNLKDTQEYKDLKSLKQILPGDTVKVIHEEDNFNIEAQMVEYKWNPLNNSYISITLGNYTKSFTSTVVNTQNEISKVKETAQSAMTTANGKNTIYSLTYKPAITNSSVEGDLLYLKNGDKTELWILKLVNGKLQWVLQVSDATQEELKAQMAQAKTDINSAVDSANAAVDKANANVQAIEANVQLITDVNAIANTAKTNAQTALDNAGKLSEDVLALDTVAKTAKSDADTALINANKGITDAKTALNKAIGVDTRVTTEITNVNNMLATKANSTTVDAIKGTVSSQGTAISQNATDIKLKADSTVVNAIKGTVDSQGTLISQNSKDIALKANKSSVDTLTGRVSANETAIDITAQGVSTLVTKTDGTNTSLSQFKQDYEGFKGTVYTKSQTDTKVSTVQQSVDNFKTTVSSTYSSKAETDSKVTAVQANIDKLGTNTAYANSSDGTDRFTTVYPNLNLLDGTKDFSGTWDRSPAWTTDGTYKGLTVKKKNDAWNGIFKPFIAQKDGAYTFSAYIKSSGNSANITRYVEVWDINGIQKWTEGNNALIGNNFDWLRGSYTLNLKTGDTVHSRYEITGSGTDSILWTAGHKWEEGTVATPYMPSEKELTSNDIPKYVGYSVRQSENPKDFSWQPYGGSNSYKIIEATTSIEQNSKEIALKANKTEVDTLSGRVLATESSLQIQDGKITALNTKADGHTTQIGSLQSSYDGLVSTVANTYLTKTDATNTYPTKTSVASQITQSATAVTSNMQSWTNNKLTAYSTTQQTANSITNAVESKADKTQITQLSDMINLRVSKGDVTSQINVEAGRTLIDTKQLLLNADTVKFTGSAFIPNSVIENLSADKITAGTLNATNVNVINLNAKSLTAGTISGNNLSLNLDTGAVQFTKGYIAGNNNKIRFDLDNSYLHSINPNGSGFKISDGQFSFFDGLLSSTPQYLGAIMLDFFSTDKSGIKVYGNKGASIQGGNSTISVGYSLLGNNKIGLSGDTGVTGGLSVLGKLSVLGSKNAIHVTRDGIRATPAYETAESYLGDIGGNYTRENCEVWVDIEKLFSDTVNTDIAYHVFLQAYDNARFWVEDFRSDKFLVRSDKPMARFAWEIKAKRRGYENDRLVVQEGFDNKMLDKVHDEGAFKGDGENESTN